MMKEKIKSKGPERQNPQENWGFSIEIKQNLIIINFSFLLENGLKFSQTIKIENITENIDVKIIQEAIERVFVSNPQIKDRFSELLEKTLGLTIKREDASSSEHLKDVLTPEQFLEEFLEQLKRASENKSGLLTKQSQEEINEALISLETQEVRAKIIDIKQILESFLGLTKGKTETIISEGLIQNNYLQEILANINQGKKLDAFKMLIEAISNSFKNKNLILPKIIFLGYIHPVVAAVAYCIVEDLSEKNKNQ
ncbi:MAG: hypothetical protein KatS3mg093_021 [Candidatus Parcubacteria bacterium]|nr:MAG: hypothetical protein KatS3mg093_021 [Candidatus Parcubacteria bacterium]